MKNLSPKREQFCQEYLTDLNATQAAIRAGYAQKTAYSMGQQLLKKIEIQKRIETLQAERSERTKVETDRVLIEIARIAFNDPRRAFDENGNLLPFDQWPEDLASAVSSIKVTETTKPGDDHRTFVKEIRFWDKGRQLELAAKHLGMLTERVQHTGGIEFNSIPKFKTPEDFISWQESQELQ